MSTKKRRFAVIAAAMLGGAILAGTAAPAMASTTAPQPQPQSAAFGNLGVSPEYFMGHVNVTFNNLTDQRMILRTWEADPKTIAVLEPGQHYTISHRDYGRSCTNNNYTLFGILTPQGEMSVLGSNLAGWWPRFEVNHVPGYGNFNARGFYDNELKTFEHDGNMYRILRLPDGDQHDSKTKNFRFTIGPTSIWKK